MTTAFKHKEKQDEFIKKGYVAFPFLNADQLEKIRNIYFSINNIERLNERHFYGVNYSLGFLKPDENSLLVEKIMSIIEPSLKEFFCDYEVLGCVFITKPANTKTTFVYHQDWNYTNEKEHAFATCWIPLFDTNKSNGCMSVIEGTHQYFDTARSATLESARIDFEEIPEEIRTDIEQKAGSCLAFHQASFHGSYPNVTDKNRPVLAFVVKSKNSPILHYVNEGNSIAAYQLSASSFNKMLTQIPNGALPHDAIRVEANKKIKPLAESKDLITAFRTFHSNHILLKDFALHEQFQKNGFLIIKNVIPKQNIAELRNVYFENFITPQGMYVSHHSEKNTLRNKSFSNKIFELLNSFFQRYFLNIQPLIAHFAAKGNGKDGLFNLHQDWSIVREELFGVMHCWIPLQDVSKENGTLAVLPQSHLCFQNYRSGTNPIRFLPFNYFEEVAIHIEASEGDVILYHPALFHGSGPNNTQNDRVAVVAAITHSKAERIYHHTIDNKTWAYKLTDDDLFSRLDELAKGADPLGERLFNIENRKLDSPDFQIIEKLLEHCPSKTSYNATI